MPSFLSSLAFYRDPRSTTSSPEYFVDMTYAHYPFLPERLVAAQNEDVNYKAVVFFLNEEAPVYPFLDSPQFPTSSAGAIVPVQYRNCADSLHISTLILADNGASCNIFIGGFTNNAVRYSAYLQEGDMHLNFELRPFRLLTSEDYITVGYYGFYRFYPAFSPPGPDGLPNFKLIAVDRIHYPARDVLPLNQPPQFSTSSLDVVFDETNSRLTVRLPPVTDPDSLDALLTYEINFSISTDFLSEDWQPIVRGYQTYERTALPGDQFMIGVRVKDTLANYSSILSTSWVYPIPVATSSDPLFE